MGKLFTGKVGKLLTRLLGNYLTATLGKVLDIYRLATKEQRERAKAGRNLFWHEKLGGR